MSQHIPDYVFPEEIDQQVRDNIADLYDGAYDGILLNEVFGAVEILIIIAVWIVGISLLSGLAILCVRRISKVAGADNLSLIDLLKKAVGEVKNEKPFILHMLGITIIAESLRSKIMFLLLLSTLIGSTTFNLFGSITGGSPIPNFIEP